MRSLVLPSLGAIALLATGIAAQGTNARLLAHVDRFPGAVAPTNNYAGVWGMVVNGQEYALVAARTGTIIYDCSDPKNPVEKGFITGPTTTGSGYFWREVHSWGNYAYVSSEHGSLQVIDMSNPNSPTLLGTFGSRAHTVAVDQGTGILWANGGAGRGSYLYDLNQSRTNPPRINSYQNGYVHDSHSIRGYAYLAHINNGTMEIVDVRTPTSIVSLSTTTTPGQFTHNVWVNDTDTIAVTADENPGGCLTIYDVTNKSAPVQKSTWCSPNGATVHNVFLQGNIAHFSSYSDGYWALDISDPSAPKAVAQYDTTSLTGNGYHGCWGCYPFQPSGVIYLCDMQTGFWIVEPTCGVPNLYGNGTAGSGGFVPTIDFDGGVAKVGNATFEVVGTKLRGGANTVLLIGAAPTQQTVLGIELLVNLPAVGVSQVAGGAAGAAGAGSVNVTIPIPNNPALALGTFYGQLVAIDAGGPAGLAASRGMKFAICP